MWNSGLVCYFSALVLSVLEALDNIHGGAVGGAVHDP